MGGLCWNESPSSTATSPCFVRSMCFAEGDTSEQSEDTWDPSQWNPSQRASSNMVEIVMDDDEHMAKSHARLMSVLLDDDAYLSKAATPRCLDAPIMETPQPESESPDRLAAMQQATFDPAPDR